MHCLKKSNQSGSILVLYVRSTFQNPVDFGMIMLFQSKICYIVANHFAFTDIYMENVEESSMIWQHQIRNIVLLCF